MRRIVAFLLLSVVAVFAASGHSDYRYGNRSSEIDPGNRPATLGLGKRLQESDVNTENLLKLLEGETQGRIDEDGDLFITNGTYKGYIFVYPNQKLVKLSATWGGTQDVDESLAIETANQFNIDKILTQASFLRRDNGDGVMRLTYQFIYDGGVNPVFLNKTLEWFWTLCSDYSDVINEKGLFNSSLSGHNKTGDGFNEGYAEGGAGGIGDGLAGLFGGGSATKAKGNIKTPSGDDVKMGAGGGSRSAADIMKVVRQRTPGLRHIYNKFLKIKPGFQGKVTLKFTIAPGGEIISISIASSTTGYGEFDGEIKNAVSRWTFSKVKSGNTTVTIPFTFSED
ncbi:TonB family protein [Fibrobacter sp. UBA2449]|uniref:TonB family protein n=1 Tax=Fibrobacter sp. UBA2449 TaxID=1946529 RepID=UPI0025BC9BB7|nr:TonB family protein [Fibrobacter sp. UBA2449]